MTPRSEAATDAARRLWARAVGDASAPEEVAAAAERLCTQLRVGLGRWVGTDGYRALLHRALGLARAEYPALTGLSCEGGEGPAIAAAVRVHGPAKVTTSVVGLVATLIDLLGRIVGEEMAVQLGEQTGKPRPRGVVTTETEAQRDG
jgi:hypothetical protein